MKISKYVADAVCKSYLFRIRELISLAVFIEGISLNIFHDYVVRSVLIENIYYSGNIRMTYLLQIVALSINQLLIKLIRFQLLNCNSPAETYLCSEIYIARPAFTEQIVHSVITILEFFSDTSSHLVKCWCLIFSLQKAKTNQQI